MIPRLVTTWPGGSRMLSFSTVLCSERKTFLFRSRLPQTNVQSPFADPTRTKVEVQDKVFITVKDPEEDSSNSLIRSFIKSAIFTKKFPSFATNNKENS